jgi:hypothetical protein
MELPPTAFFILTNPTFHNCCPFLKSHPVQDPSKKKSKKKSKPFSISIISYLCAPEINFITTVP